MIRTAMRLALADYRHDRLLSVCAVCTLAAVLVPLLVLLGVHNGIITSMTERLLSDPKNLEVIPSGSGRYDTHWFAELQAHKGVGFLIPQTRSIAATIDLTPEEKNSPRSFASLIPSSADDPVLQTWLEPQQASDDNGVRLSPGSDLSLPVSVVLSSSSARLLDVRSGDSIEGHFGRVYEGRRENVSVPLVVAAVLPLAAQQREAVYAPLSLLLAAEDYRDGKAVLSLGWEGDEPAGDERLFPNFRLYARSLDDVDALRVLLENKNIAVHTQVEAIELVRTLDRGFTLVFLLICGASLFGLGSSIAGNAMAGVMRKSRSLGIMRQLGMRRGALMVFPLTQALLSSFLGTLLAFALYCIVAVGINRAFAASISNGDVICSLKWTHLLAVLGFVLFFSLLATSKAAWRASRIEPSEVIRDV